MVWKILKPTKWTILAFIILFILSLVFFVRTDTRIFPCKTQPVVPNPPPFRDYMCGLGAGIGARNVFSPAGYLLMFLVLIILPYVIACLVNLMIRQRTVRQGNVH